MPSVTFFAHDGVSFGFENSTEISDEDVLFVREIDEVAKGVSANAKSIGDERARLLCYEKLWRDLISDGPKVALSFFDNWYEWTGTAGVFWRQWYISLVDGEPIDWKLQEKIALIPDDVWEAGPEAVAREIERIEGQFWSEHLPQAEEVVETENGRYDVQPSVQSDQDLVDRMFTQAEFVLDLSLTTNCGFSEMCVGFKLLRHTLDNCRNDPNAIEQNFRMARDIISGNIAKAAYDDHDALKALVQSLNDSALQLRGQHSEVRAAYEVRVQQSLREVDDATKVEVAEAMREFQQEKAAGRLYLDTGLDAETVETGSSIEAQASAIQRTGGRAAVARGMERASKAAKDVDASGGYKAARIGTTGYTIVDLLVKVFGG